LFDILGARVRDAEVLDLFAGTGAVGIEALSRGARRVVFVEIAARAIRLIEANLERTGLKERATVLRGPVEASVGTLAGAGERFDIVFADPPYADGFPASSIESAGRLLRSGGVLLIEHAVKRPIECDRASALRPGRAYRYGDSGLALFHRDSDEGTP